MRMMMMMMMMMMRMMISKHDQIILVSLNKRALHPSIFQPFPGRFEACAHGSCRRPVAPTQICGHPHRDLPWTTCFEGTHIQVQWIFKHTSLAIVDTIYEYIWYDMIWYDMIWYGMIWYDMIWYDMIWYMSKSIRLVSNTNTWKTRRTIQWTLNNKRVGELWDKTVYCLSNLPVSEHMAPHSWTLPWKLFRTLNFQLHPDTLASCIHKTSVPNSETWRIGLQ